MLNVVTVGVYGYTPETFFAALQEAGVDLLCDIRQRRGVRGAEYAFANSQRLQARLAELGIHYLHRKDLAPTTAVRQRQEAADKASKTPRRQRNQLSPHFIAAYQEEILAHFDPDSLLADLPAGTQTIALLCVEGEPAACHRSLVAARLHDAWGVEIKHLTP